MQEFRGINGVAERRVGSLHRQVSQQDGVRLDAVAFFVVVCSVQQLPGQICPLTSDSFVIEFSHLY